MSVLYCSENVNVVADDIISVVHVFDSKNELVKYMHRFARLGVRLEDSSKRGFMVHHNSQLTLMV